jgi:gamma-glutamylcysteine synthetase
MGSSVRRTKALVPAALLAAAVAFASVSKKTTMKKGKIAHIDKKVATDTHGADMVKKLRVSLALQPVATATTFASAACRQEDRSGV